MEITDPRAGGHLNAVLCISNPLTSYEELYGTIAETFQPGEVSQMLRNVATDEVDFPDTPVLPPLTDSALWTYFQKDEEMIVLGWYEGSATIEHSCFAGAPQLTGQHTIAKLLNSSPDIELILGFGLEITVDRLEDAIIQNISDRSLWPIIIVKKKDGQTNIDRRIQEGSGTDVLVEALDKYLSDINSSL